LRADHHDDHHAQMKHNEVEDDEVDEHTSPDEDDNKNPGFGGFFNHSSQFKSMVNNPILTKATNCSPIFLT
jgi:hypothetical protein